MARNETATNNFGEDSEAKPTKSRTPRSIRFSDPEWARIENEAKDRGMTAAELVRYAAVSFAEGKLTPNTEAFPLEIAAQIERIYRGVYLLSTLKRDEMVRNGQQEALGRIQKKARESQTVLLHKGLHTRPSINSAFALLALGAQQTREQTMEATDEQEIIAFYTQ